MAAEVVEACALSGAVGAQLLEAATANDLAEDLVG
jgi:hypothetical protein